ncbi:LuxR C-terminal-related transcriptional regulator [Allomuricauda taeanensis]|uniref:LuxR C-terminal-related transcriptional regulator n=1 Tax=Flagellimonas taeanensis TaxID=1005926 RepID=UPI002E7B6936|nr:LuxR C-terminal-related transcriptional regulator [Allomuricauda taeanensis]MEE1964639.1 LuxR C-terminal-related transcriptional regulator [Allomuricauda taeanensis]
MSQVKQILRMHKQGKGIKTIARTLSISKNTVKGYIKKVRAGTLPIEALLNLEDPVLEGKLWPGNPAYKDGRYEHLKTQLEYYSKELKRTGVTRQLLWEEYKTGALHPYSYGQFCWHL